MNAEYLVGRMPMVRHIAGFYNGQLTTAHLGGKMAVLWEAVHIAQ